MSCNSTTSKTRDSHGVNLAPLTNSNSYLTALDTSWWHLKESDKLLNTGLDEGFNSFLIVKMTQREQARVCKVTKEIAEHWQCPLESMLCGAMPWSTEQPDTSSTLSAFRTCLAFMFQGLQLPRINERSQGMRGVKAGCSWVDLICHKQRPTPRSRK